MAIKSASTEWRQVVLVCRKCSKKLDGGFGPDGDLTLKQALRRYHQLPKGKKGRKHELAVVGADCFAHAARACARAIPPRTPVLAEHVQVFPAFIADGPLVDALPYLADVARLEAACLRVFHAADAPSPPLDAWQRLQADPQRLAATRLRLHPACAWLACTHAVVDLWQAHMRAASMESADLAGIDPDHAQDALLWRNDDGLVQVAALPPGCAAALDALQAGAALLPVLSRLPGDAAATLLAHLAGDGVVTDILVPTVEAT